MIRWTSQGTYPWLSRRANHMRGVMWLTNGQSLGNPRWDRILGRSLPNPKRKAQHHGMPCRRPSRAHSRIRDITGPLEDA